MKKMNKKGFTLMEMLIVIAIIAILIAIAIPTFTSAMEKAHQKTDLANARALKSAVLSDFMLGDDAKSITKGKAGTYYLKEGGQTISTTETGCIVTTSSKLKDSEGNAVAKNTAISITIDDQGIITASTPDITKEANS